MKDAILVMSKIEVGGVLLSNLNRLIPLFILILLLLGIVLVLSRNRKIKLKKKIMGIFLIIPILIVPLTLIFTSNQKKDIDKILTTKAYS